MIGVPEFRVTYRREGGQRQHRIYQKRGTADRLMAALKKDTREDLAPLVELEFEIRECGPWSKETEKP